MSGSNTERTSTLSMTAIRAINLSNTLNSPAKFFPGFSSVATTFGTAGTWRWRPGAKMLLPAPIVSKVVIEKVSLYTPAITTSLISVFWNIESREYRVTSLPDSLSPAAEICNVYRCQIIRFPDSNERGIPRERAIFIEIKCRAARIMRRDDRVIRLAK